jgi:putative glycosyltransferase (TIGR04372 family)
VKVSLLITARIGHLALNTEAFLRNINLKDMGEKQFTIFLADKNNIANHALYHMWGKNIFIVDNRILRILLTPLVYFSSRFYQETPIDSNEYDLFNNTMPSLKLSIDDEEKGKKILAKMGLGKEDWFVCIFARDSAYLKKLYPETDTSYHDYRDADINTYIEAASYIIDQGGWVIRSGNLVEHKMAFTHEKFIDYPFSEYNSDFMDVFLQIKAKMVIGTPSGITDVAAIFDTPFCGVNIMPIDYGPISKNSIFIPKKLREKSTKDFLPLAKYFDLLDSIELDKQAVYEYYSTQFYRNNNLEIVNNTSEEILDLCKEMLEKLNGESQKTEKDEKLQNQYQLIHSRSLQYGEVKTPIGKEFLKKNEWYIK